MGATTGGPTIQPPLGVDPEVGGKTKGHAKVAIPTTIVIYYRAPLC